MQQFVQVSPQSPGLSEKSFEKNKKRQTTNPKIIPQPHQSSLHETSKLHGLEGTQSNSLSFLEERNRRVASYRRRSFIGKTCLSTGNQGKMFTLSFLGLFIPAFAFILYEIQYIHGLRSKLSFDIDLWLIIILLNSGSCFCLFVICSLSDPGFLTIPLKQEDRKALPAVQKKGSKEYFLNYCVTCKIYRPIRTHHCKICDLCVMERDHHCPFLNNCIGRRNRRSYTYFLITSVLQQILIISESLCQLLIPFIAKHPASFLSQLQRVPFILAAVQLLYAGLLGINILSLLIFQMKLIKHNLTTDEFRRLLGPQKFDLDIELNTLFDRGYLRNFMGILCCCSCLSPPEPIYAKFEPLSYEYRFKRFLHDKRKEMFQYENNQEIPQKNPFENEEIQDNIQKDNEDEEKELVNPRDLPSPPHSPNQIFKIVGLLQTKPSLSPSRFAPSNQENQQRFFPRQMSPLKVTDIPQSEDTGIIDVLPSPQTYSTPMNNNQNDPADQKHDEYNQHNLNNLSFSFSSQLFSHRRLYHPQPSSTRRSSYDPARNDDQHHEPEIHSYSLLQQQIQDNNYASKGSSINEIPPHESLRRALSSPVISHHESIIEHQKNFKVQKEQKPLQKIANQKEIQPSFLNSKISGGQPTIKSPLSRQFSGLSESDFNSKIIFYDIIPCLNSQQLSPNSSKILEVSLEQESTPQKEKKQNEKLKKSIYRLEIEDDLNLNMIDSQNNIDKKDLKIQNYPSLKLNQHNNHNPIYHSATPKSEPPKRGSLFSKNNIHHQLPTASSENNQIITSKFPSLGLVRFTTNSTNHSNPRHPPAQFENTMKNQKYQKKLSKQSSLFDKVQEQSTSADTQTPRNVHFTHRSNTHSTSNPPSNNLVILTNQFQENEQDDFNNPKPECNSPTMPQNVQNLGKMRNDAQWNLILPSENQIFSQKTDSKQLDNHLSPFSSTHLRAMNKIQHHSKRSKSNNSDNLRAEAFPKREESNIEQTSSCHKKIDLAIEIGKMRRYHKNLFLASKKIQESQSNQNI